MTSIWRFALRGAVVATAFVASAPAMAQLTEAVNEAENATAAAAASQERIDRIADETGDLYREYRAVLNQIESQRLFVDQQRVFVRSQENEIEDIQVQIGEVDNVRKSLLPMQLEMIARLEDFVNLDIPFHQRDRADRVSRLKELMDRPDVAPAEKYRQIVEAYLIEAEYGRKLDTYEAKFGEGEDAPVVDYLLIGRVAFLYMSKDENQLGIWNPETKGWEDLPGSYRAELRKAIRMAKEVASPDVFTAPVPGPTNANAG
jgi:hypothetical protein